MTRFSILNLLRMDLFTGYGYENGDHHHFEFIEDGLVYEIRIREWGS